MHFASNLGVIDAIAANRTTRSSRKSRFLSCIFLWGQSEFAGLTNNTGAYQYVDAVGWTGNLTADGAPTGVSASPVLAMPIRGVYPGAFVAYQTNPQGILPFYPSAFASTGVLMGSTFEPGILSELFRYEEAAESDYLIVNASLPGSSVATLAAMSVPPKTLPSQLMSAIDANLTTREKLYKLLWCAHLEAQRRGQRLRLLAGIRGQGKGDVGNANFGTQIVADCQTIDTWCKTYLGQGASFYFHNQVALSNNGTALDSNVSVTTETPLDTQILDASVTAQAAGFPFYCLGSVYPYGQRLHPYGTWTWGAMFGNRLARMLWGGYDGKPLTIAWTRNGSNAIRGVPNMPIALVANSGMGIRGTLQNGFATNTHGLVPICGTGAHITGVTLTNPSQLDVTLSNTVVAGDFICTTGAAARYSNIREVNQRLATILDTNPAATVDGSGNMPIHFDTVAATPCPFVDISHWAASDKKALP